MSVGKSSEAGGGAAAAAEAPSPAGSSDPPPAPALATLPRPPLQSYVLSGAADPPLLQQARGMTFQLMFAAIGFAKLVPHLSWPQLRSTFCIPGAINALCLVAVQARPQAYRSLRLHLWISPLLQLVVLWGAMHFRTAADTVFPSKTALDKGGVQASLTFLVMLLLLSGVTSALAAFPLYTVPPVALLLLAAPWAAIMSAGNAGVCSADLLQHSAVAWHLHASYRVLAPLVAPLEPLLLAAGIGRDHPARHCHCVLAALQFWVVALAIPLALVRGQVKGYTAWRVEQRRLDQQRRREMSKAWGFGFKEPSSSSEESSSEGSSQLQSPRSPRTAIAKEVYTRLLHRAALPPNDVGPAAAAGLVALRPGKPPVRLYQGRPLRRHHRADWQYVWALRTLRMLRPTTTKLAVLALCASALSAWHRATFP